MILVDEAQRRLVGRVQKLDVQDLQLLHLEVIGILQSR